MADNWYLILELDFDPEIKDADVIKKRIMEKLSFWNKNKTAPTDDAREYERLAKLFKQIESDMSNEATRSKCAADARRRMEDDIDPIIKEIGENGFITDEQVKSIAKNKKISENVISKRATRLGIKIMVSPKVIYDKYFGSEPGDKLTYDTRIAKDLVAFRVDSLYGFIFSDTASNASKEAGYERGVLLLRASDREKEFEKLHASNHQKAAGTSLSKSCADFFKDDASRKKYDKYLEFIRIEKIFLEINIYKGSEIKQERAAKFISDLSNAIQSKDDAEQLFLYYCQDKGIAYVKTEKVPVTPVKDAKTELFEAIRVGGMSGFLTQKQADGFIAKLMPFYSGNVTIAKNEFNKFCSANGIVIEKDSPLPMPVTVTHTKNSGFRAWFSHIPAPAKVLAFCGVVTVAVLAYGGIFAGWFKVNVNAPSISPSENFVSYDDIEQYNPNVDTKDATVDWQIPYSQTLKSYAALPNEYEDGSIQEKLPYAEYFKACQIADLDNDDVPELLVSWHNPESEYSAIDVYHYVNDAVEKVGTCKSLDLIEVETDMLIGKMNISTRLLYGNSLSQNIPPGQNSSAKIKLSGTYTGKANVFTLDDDILSKHTMLIGGTGCGKTTLFYHFVSQIKRKMTSDDIMIIFDSKGDFHNKFYNKSTDFIIGNSKQYSSISEYWNIYKEILADGWEERDYIIKGNKDFYKIGAVQALFTITNEYSYDTLTEPFRPLPTG